MKISAFTCLLIRDDRCPFAIPGRAGKRPLFSITFHYPARTDPVMRRQPITQKPFRESVANGLSNSGYYPATFPAPSSLSSRPSPLHPPSCPFRTPHSALGTRPFSLSHFLPFPSPSSASLRLRARNPETGIPHSTRHSAMLDYVRIAGARGSGSRSRGSK